MSNPQTTCNHQWTHDENMDRSGWHRTCRICGETEFTTTRTRGQMPFDSQKEYEEACSTKKTPKGAVDDFVENVFYEDDLLPCPFCGAGGQSDDNSSSPDGEKVLHWVECGGKCAVDVTAYGDTREEAKNKWNTRQ